MKTLLKAVLLGLGALAGMPAMATIIIGNPPNIGNSFPWGTAYNAEYQQVYASSDFSGPITITDLEFFNTFFRSGSTQLPTGTWTIDLSTTAASPTTISATFANNLGSDNTQVFSGSINQPWAFGDTLHILLTTPFTYNPANGNLLMDVVGSNISTPGGSTFFDFNTNTTAFSRVFCNGVPCAVGTVESLHGLVTGFSTSVPEPATLALLSVGLAGLGFARRRKLN